MRLKKGLKWSENHKQSSLRAFLRSQALK